MQGLIIDRKALGLHPNWENILIDLIDLERKLEGEPKQIQIAQGILIGFTQREIAASTGLHLRQVQREIDKIRR